LRKLVSGFDEHWIVPRQLSWGVLGLRLDPFEDRMISEFAWTL